MYVRAFLPPTSRHRATHHSVCCSIICRHLSQAGAPKGLIEGSRHGYTNLSGDAGGHSRQKACRASACCSNSSRVRASQRVFGAQGLAERSPTRTCALTSAQQTSAQLKRAPVVKPGAPFGAPALWTAAG
eukprot:200540-Chlamydomonas_euryale.AAC.1